MTIGEWLENVTSRLQTAEIRTARLDALVLLEDILGKERSWPLAHPEHQLESREVKKLESLIQRRTTHEPLAYIRGRSEFWGREFAVNAHTLEPRPETETMVELLTQLVSKEQRAKSKGTVTEPPSLSTRDKRQETRDDKLTLVDVGTGSGCIAITTKLELSHASVYATDIDEKCLETAQTNAQNLGADVTFAQGNLLHPLSAFDFLLSTDPWVVLANLPYVPDSHQINQAAMHEPHHAIFGGIDGLDYYRQLFSQIETLANKPKMVLTESLPPQHQNLSHIAQQHDYQLGQSRDFIQVFTRQKQD